MKKLPFVKTNFQTSMKIYYVPSCINNLPIKMMVNIENNEVAIAKGGVFVNGQLMYL